MEWVIIIVSVLLAVMALWSEVRKLDEPFTRPEAKRIENERTICPWCICRAREHAEWGWTPPMLGRIAYCDLHNEHAGHSSAVTIAQTFRGGLSYAKRTGVGSW